MIKAELAFNEQNKQLCFTRLKVAEHSQQTNSCSSQLEVSKTD